MDAERSINLFESTLDVIDAMDGETVKRFLKAIRDYAFDGIEPSKSDMAIYIPWRMVKFSLDRHNEIIDSKREAGRKSGESRRAKSNTREQNGTEDNSVQLCSNTNEQKRTNVNKREQTRTRSKSVQLCSTEKEKESEIEKEIEKEIESENENISTNRSATATPVRSVSDSSKIHFSISEFTKNNELQVALNEFVKMRSKMKKPLTPYAFQNALSKLKHLGNQDDAQMTAIVNQSIEKSWLTFYELKDAQSTTTQETAESIPKKSSFLLPF